MTKEQYWLALLAKNPKMAERDQVTIKTEIIQKIVYQAYEEGKQQGATVNSIFDSTFAGRK